MYHTVINKPVMYVNGLSSPPPTCNALDDALTKTIARNYELTRNYELASLVISKKFNMSRLAHCSTTIICHGLLSIATFTHVASLEKDRNFRRPMSEKI